MKKFAFAAAAAAFALAAAGCERQGVPALAEGEIRVMLLTDDSGIDDRSFNAAAWRGILEFFGETWDYAPSRGRLFNVVTAETAAMYITNLMHAIDERPDLIVTAGFTWRESVMSVAITNPQQNFLIVDVAGIGLPNVMEAVYVEHEGSFLVGAAAALQAIEEGVENPSFGFIGGIAGEIITRFHVGFVQGVLYVLPGAEIHSFYVGSFSEPALARTQAMNWFDAGVYAIFSAAGDSGNGAIIEAAAQRQAGRNVWAIGVDSDQFHEGLYPDFRAGPNSAVLTSMIKRVEAGVYYALGAVRDGSFYGRTVRFGLPEGGVGFSTANPALSEGVIARVEEIRQRIIDGDIAVAPTLAAARQIPGFPEVLTGAIDG